MTTPTPTPTTTSLDDWNRSEALTTATTAAVAVIEAVNGALHGFELRSYTVIALCGLTALMALQARNKRILYERASDRFDGGEEEGAE